MSRLDVFVAPKPNYPLICAMTLVNRALMLKGIVGLRDMAPFNRLAGLRGIANVRHIDFPRSDEGRLARVCGAGRATFLTPNHPEFFTDWMIDKEIAARVAPKAAFWATHGVVNGLGRLAQKFWLANNLIAQIPGNSAPARDYSVDWALKGHGVLLHPEGGVGWHGDHVAPLMPGVVEMAREALAHGRKTNACFEVWIAPMVWKLTFDHDVEPELLKECAYVERRLKMTAPSRCMSLPRRVFRIYDTLLARDELTCGLEIGRANSFVQRKRNLIKALCESLAEMAGHRGKALEAGHVLRVARRHLREQGVADAATAKRMKFLADMLSLNLRLGDFTYRSETISQEELASHLKRIRNDYCKGSLRDTLNRFVPQAAGPRTAHIRVPEPLAMHDFAATDEEALEMIRTRMQAALDRVNDELEASGQVRLYPNPFHG